MDEYWPSTQATLAEYRTERPQFVQSHDGPPAHRAAERPPSPGGLYERGWEPEDQTVARIQAARAQLEDSRNRVSARHADMMAEQQPLRLGGPLRRLVDTWKVRRKGHYQTKNDGQESEKEDQGYLSKTGRRRDSELSVISPSFFDPGERLLDEKHMNSQVLNGEFSGYFLVTSPRLLAFAAAPSALTTFLQLPLLSWSQQAFVLALCPLLRPSPIMIPTPAIEIHRCKIR
ncbi:hypothetical protein JCM11641_008279 [Rhodosporidiobolus odoratus]